MNFLASLIRFFRNPKSDLGHSKRPYQSSELNALAEAKMNEIKASAYYQHVFPLKEKVVGKTVLKSLAGTSGFALFLSNGEWIATYLSDMNLKWEMGAGEFPETLVGLMNSIEYGNGYFPLPVNLPYANQICDIGNEIANAHGKEITGLSFGTRCFNFCFANGMELDTTIIPTSDNKHALRVFWEQW